MLEAKAPSGGIFVMLFRGYCAQAKLVVGPSDVAVGELEIPTVSVELELVEWYVVGEMGILLAQLLDEVSILRRLTARGGITPYSSKLLLPRVHHCRVEGPVSTVSEDYQNHNTSEG